ncbi:MAG TPA: ABC transporter substrate-binding protein [Cellvibrio sp.]|nr:ABC transporter substrate-binding protein [Cellvibrio sp.]
MSTALSGPLQYLGIPLSQGIQQKIAEANCDPYWRNKGIQFELTVLDDSYDPEAAAQNTLALIDKHNVIALVGNLGTPTANTSWKIANDKRVIFYGAYTGSNILRLTPPAPYVFNYRPSYDQEMEYIVRNIIDRGVPVSAIGLFLQNDAFGNAGLISFEKALSKQCGNCMGNILQMRYERNSLTTNIALQTFIAAEVKPKAVILVGSIEPVAEFIRFAHRLSPGTRFYSLSFTSATAFREKFEQEVFDLTVSQVVPTANVTGNTNNKNAEPENEVFREGYLAMELLLDSMRTITGSINSETLRASLIKTEQKLPGDPTDHQMMNEVWLTHFNNNQAKGEAAANVE